MKATRLHLALAAKVVLAAGVLAYLVHLVEPAAILAAAREADAAWLAAAFALLPLNFALQGLVWYLLVRLVMPRVRFLAAFSALLCGYPLGIITPAHAGDLVGRSFYLPHGDRWELASVAAVHRVMELAASMGLGTLALWYYLKGHPLEPAAFWRAMSYVGAGLTLLLTGLILFPRATHAVAARFVRPAIARRVAFLGRLPAPLAAFLLLLCVGAYATYTTQFYCLLRAFTPGAPVLEGYLGISLVYFVKNFIPPLTFLDVGVREGAAVFFLGGLGFPSAAALNAAFLLFCINFLIPALVGLPLVFRLRLGKQDPARSAAGAAEAATS